jgi:hypothetical protein
MLVGAALGLALLSGVLAGCSANRNCLEGALATRFADRPDLQLVQREFKRGSEASPAVRARIYEALPSLFPDLSDRRDEPACAPQLVEALAAELGRRPLRFDNATFHWLDALGSVGDTTDVMPEKARLLLRVAALKPDAIGDYQRLPEERGPTPTATQLRARALAHLALSNLFLNDGRVRRFLLDKALQSSDPREEGLLAFAAANVFRGSGEAKYARPLLEHWLAQSRRRLSEPPAPATLEVLLSHLNYLGAYADRNGLETQVRPLLQGIIAADGEVPLTLGQRGGAQDLLVRAAQALDDSLDGPEHQNWLEPDLPFPARRRVSRVDWALDDSTVVEWTPDVTGQRLRELDQELAQTHDPELRCWLVRQRGAWTPRAQRETWFNAQLGDVRAPTCALTAALALEGIPARTRAKAVAGLLEEPGLPRPLEAPTRTLVGWLALVDHPDWLDADGQLQERLVEQALAEDARVLWAPKHDMSSIDLARIRFELQAVLERALGLLALSATPEARTRAAALGRHWLELARASQGAAFNDLYTFQLSTALLLSLASLGPRLGLEQEVEDLLSAVPKKDDKNLRLARFVFERSRR